MCANGVSDGSVPLFHVGADYGLHETSIPSLSGKTVLVTGASSGLGLGVARLLARKHATLIITCRDEAKCAAAIRDIQAGTVATAENVRCVPMELLELRSVRAAGAAIGELLASKPLDLLVLNAGIMMPPRLQLGPVDGLEIQFQTNHLGHFLLLHALLPSLRAARDPRVVAVSSVAHWFSPPAEELMRVAALNDAAAYSPVAWYGFSKLCNILMARELHRREPHIGAYAVHPGGVQGKLMRFLPLPARVVAAFERLVYWDIETAALTVIAPLVVARARMAPGAYLVPIARERSPSAQAASEALGRRLWEWSSAWI